MTVQQRVMPGPGLQFVNAKGILCMLTAIGTFMLPYSQSQAFLLVGSLVLAFTAFVSDTCWTLFGVTFQRLLSWHRRPFNIVMGLLLLYCAVSLFL